MQSTISAAAFLALVSSVLAQTEGFDAITAPTKDQTVQAGQVCVITWDASPEYNEDTVTIRLMQGADEGSLDFNPTDIAGMSHTSPCRYNLQASIVLTREKNQETSVAPSAPTRGQSTAAWVTTPRMA